MCPSSHSMANPSSSSTLTGPTTRRSRSSTSVRPTSVFQSPKLTESSLSRPNDAASRIRRPRSHQVRSSRRQHHVVRLPSSLSPLPLTPRLQPRSHLPDSLSSFNQRTHRYARRRACKWERTRPRDRVDEYEYGRYEEAQQGDRSREYLLPRR